MTSNPASNKVELVQSSDTNKYILNSRLDILFLLRELMRRGAMISAFFNEGNDHFLTTLLTVDDESLTLDWSPNPDINRKALESRKIVFIANHDKVKVQFVCPGLKEVQFEGRSAFRGATPGSVMRLQRREYYRLVTPVSRPVKCLIPTSDRFALREAEAAVLDISNGGVCLLAPPEGMVLKVGLSIENCRIVLPDMGALHTTLQVRNAFDVTLENGSHVRRFGCQFLNVDGTAMNLIQRYIIRIERDRRAKETGLV